MPDAPPAELKSAIADGRALIICGAGVSRAATNGAAPGWERLIRDSLVEAGVIGGVIGGYRWVIGDTLLNPLMILES